MCDKEAFPVSVVIPTLNEEALIGRTVGRCLDYGAAEVIVADGGSRDQTVKKAAHQGAITVVCPQGRAVQMNAGARLATGSVLLFLHADSLVDPGFVEAMMAALNQSNVHGGAFSMELDDTAWLFRLIAFLSNGRARLLGLPYGDQGIFVRREAFEDLGGYKPIPLLEDLEFAQRLKKRGKLVMLRHRLVSSARRWRVEGVLKVTLRSWGIGLAYGLGVSPERLAKLYGPPVR